MAEILTYENETTERLNSLYDITKYKEPATQTMAAPQIAEAAFVFLSVSSEAGKIVGVRKEDLELKVKLAKCDLFEGIAGHGLNECTVQALWAKEYATLEDEEGQQVLFPTEKLMINQKVPTR